MNREEKKKHFHIHFRRSRLRVFHVRNIWQLQKSNKKMRREKNEYTIERRLRPNNIITLCINNLRKRHNENVIKVIGVFFHRAKGRQTKRWRGREGGGENK